MNLGRAGTTLHGGRTATLALRFALIPIGVWLGCLLLRYGVMALIGGGPTVAHVTEPLAAVLTWVVIVSRLSFGILAVRFAVVARAAAARDQVQAPRKVTVALVLGVFALVTGVLSAVTVLFEG